MGDIIGSLDRETLYKKVELETLDPVASAIWHVAHGTHPEQFHENYDPKKDRIQVAFPGPVIEYELINSKYILEIFHNGNKKLTEEFYNYLIS